ncbi:HAD superfamily hydrolase (TIGR01509 family) [Rhodobacter aestuarii]|uniref:phosphoglycolate phosphatase n=1 Tax=Rhodobacter aestuarii TaxID=453582 RepID=A0A1N7LQM7_9RHOB|nr:HAD family phosphatase [Rhodobacter aestuarii]PTV95090.1 HAD superfamily hydrolase (TIGR01509 family) [Rhodobacter aestuarii]SIS76147.1 haloacid dehalogenase superfamily, subfamily IA, variant 3 with third motif having DD or ED [Rhodobacter aestuarii]
MTIKAVLFDCDGVLVDSEPATFAALQVELAAHGLHLSLEEMEQRFIGGTMEKLRQTANEMGAGLPPEWVGEFYEKLYTHLRAGTPLMPGIEALLDRLDAAGISYAVGSNGHHRKMEASLGQHPRLWARLKDRLFSGQELGCPKPDPGLYLHAAAFLSVAPTDCVVVEDSATGARSAIAAGMRCFGLVPPQGSDHARETLTAVGAELIADLGEIPALIGLR